MTITLKPEQEDWLHSLVAMGDFASIEEAARALIDDRMAELSIDDGDDMAWARPFADEAEASVARGDVVAIEDHKAHMAALLATLKR